MLCDDRRPGKGELEEYIIALLDVGGQPELYLNPWLFFIIFQAASLLIPSAPFHLGIFREKKLKDPTANQNHSTKTGFFELWVEC